jgi:hypothetical protein
MLSNTYKWGGAIDTISLADKKRKHVEEHWTVGWMIKETQKKLLLGENNTRNVTIHMYLLYVLKKKSG